MSKDTKVISAFPGLGKTHFYENQELELDVLDSDSSKFDKEFFPQNYIEHIKENIGKVDIILVSSHKEVRDALVDNNINFFLCYPKRDTKEEFYRRYKERGSPDGFIEFVMGKWDEWIDEIESEDGYIKVGFKKDQYLSDIIQENGRISFVKRRRRKSTDKKFTYDKVNRRRAKQPKFIREMEVTENPYTLRWWLSMLSKASHEERLAINDGDVYNRMRFINLWSWIQNRIVKKYGE